MNDDITLSGVVFARASQNELESKRFNMSNGITNPRTLTIKRQNSRNSATKQNETRHLVRFDTVYGDGSEGSPRTPAYAYVVFGYESDAPNAGAAVADVIVTLKAFLASANPDYVNLVLQRQN